MNLTDDLVVGELEQVLLGKCARSRSIAGGHRLRDAAPLAFIAGGGGFGLGVIHRSQHPVRH